MSYRGGAGGNRSGGGGRYGRGRGSGGRGSGGGSSGGGGGGGGNPLFKSAKFNPCKNYTTTGSCPNGDKCHYAHVVRLHAAIDASSYVPATASTSSSSYGSNHNAPNSQVLASVSSVAVWECNGVIKIFTGSHDGFWRLWNTSGGNFSKEFESSMSGRVECLEVVNQTQLFCGFEAVTVALPDIPTGMVHAWNLQQPGNPPLELQIKPPHLPYAHNQIVSALTISAIEGGAPAKVVSGSMDGSIRVWTFQDTSFVLEQTLAGHARQVTGLVLVLPNLLWSCGTDNAIRIWDLTTGECQYSITKNTAAPSAPPTSTSSTIIQHHPQQQGVGHSSAVTGLLSFESPGVGTFILSSSLDGTVKAWNATTGECVASEAHGEGVVCIALAKDGQGNQLLLIGTEKGNILCRNLVQTQKAAAFQLLFCLTNYIQVGHRGAVNAITQGPAATFYTVGQDGRMLVLQFAGDMGLQ